MKEKIDWLKIDVEGFEVEVLNGAKNIIKIGSPRIIMEVASENIEMRDSLSLISLGAIIRHQKISITHDK